MTDVMLECPACQTLNPSAHATCTRCGSELAEFRSAAPPGATPRRCPRCAEPLWKLSHADLSLEECRACGGYWIDEATVTRATQRAARNEKTTAPPTAPSARPVEKNRYVRCPVCNKQMARLNFAKISGVIVDICQGHGTWFDRDELRAVLQFVEQGGLDRAKAKEAERLQAALRERQAKQRADAARPNPPQPAPHDDDGAATATIIGTVIDLLLAFL